MVNACYGRVSDLIGLPELIVHTAGEDALRYALAKQSIPVDILTLHNAIIPIKDIIAVYRNAAEVSAIRSFGLEAAKDNDINDYGTIGRFVMQATTLRQALLRLQMVLPIYENGSRLTLQKMGSEFIIGYESIYQNLSGFRQAGDMILRIIEGVVRGFAGNHCRPHWVMTCHAKGPWEQDYEDSFSAPVLFDGDKISLAYGRNLLNRTRNLDEVSLCEHVSLSDLQKLELDLPRDFPGVVAQMVEARLSIGKFSLEQIAKSLALGPRTVQRRLDEYGIGFSQIVERCRMRKARELLAETDASIWSISREVGYSNTSHFTRAFSRVNEQTPTNFRMNRDPLKNCK